MYKIARDQSLKLKVKSFKILHQHSDFFSFIIIHNFNSNLRVFFYSAVLLVKFRSLRSYMCIIVTSSIKFIRHCNLDAFEELKDV